MEEGTHLRVPQGTQGPPLPTHRTWARLLLEPGDSGSRSPERPEE